MRDVGLILVDDWWEHHCVTQKWQDLVRDVREITKPGKQVLWDGFVRAGGTMQKVQSGKSAERTAKVAFLRTKTHRIESRAMWEIPVASIRISYSSFAGAKPRSRLCIKGPGPEVRPPSFLHGKRPVNHEKNCYVNRTMNKLPGQRVWATRWLCTASRRKLGQESGWSR